MMVRTGRSIGLLRGGTLIRSNHTRFFLLQRNVIACGPYYCAQGSLRTALYNCMKPGRVTPLPSLRVFLGEAERRARRGEIDATSHLAGARAWLFSGANDATVH